MIYYAVDPGKTTGVAWLAADASTSFGCGQVEGRADAEDLIARVMDDWHAEVTLIVERWDVRSYTHTLSNQDDPRYIIGWIEGEARRRGIPYVEQTPAKAKRFGTDLRLQKLGWYVPGQDHSRDAARHLATYLAVLKGEAGDYVRSKLAS